MITYDHIYHHPIDFIIEFSYDNTDSFIERIHVKALDSKYSLNNQFITLARWIYHQYGIKQIRSNNIVFKTKNGGRLPISSINIGQTRSMTISDLLSIVIDKHLSSIQSFILQSDWFRSSDDDVDEYSLESRGFDTPTKNNYFDMSSLLFRYTFYSRRFWSSEFKSPKLSIIPANIPRGYEPSTMISILTNTISKYMQYGSSDIQFLLDNSELHHGIEFNNYSSTFKFLENNKFKDNKYLDRAHFSVVGQKTALDYLRWRNSILYMQLQNTKYPTDWKLFIDKWYPNHKQQLLIEFDNMLAEIDPVKALRHCNFRVCDTSIRRHRKHYDKLRGNSHCGCYCYCDKLIDIDGTTYSIGMHYGD